MIRNYFKERLSWIFLFIFLQCLFLLVAYLDTSISFRSVLYIVFLSVIIFAVFFIIRYQKEIKFYRSLEELDDHLDLSNLMEAKSPFEQIIESSLKAQTEKLKKEVSDNRQSLEEEKDQLLSWIHEVKTPLTAMHLIIERFDNQEVKSQLTFEWLRIHLLLDQQLHQRRIPFIENDLFIEPVDLKSIVSTEIKTLRSWCMQKGIGFELRLDITKVISDAKWLAFILRQIITNAVKYSMESDITIKSYTSDEHIQLEIKDCGRGIDAKDLPRIFDKGFTSTTSHQDNASTGMGLYLAKKAAVPLQIHINVQSSPGNGTTFTLTFPKKNEFIRITGV